MYCMLRALLKGMIEIICFRINSFLKPVLNLIESYELRHLSMQERLRPVIKYEMMIIIIILFIVIIITIFLLFLLNLFLLL
jgi:large-conductance mechanosensitive channel